MNNRSGTRMCIVLLLCVFPVGCAWRGWCPDKFTAASHAPVNSKELVRSERVQTESTVITEVTIDPESNDRLIQQIAAEELATPAIANQSNEPNEPNAKTGGKELDDGTIDSEHVVPPPAPQFADMDVALEDVIESVYRSYPLLEGAFYGRNIADGDRLAAQGQFDLKLKGSTENGPVGFYQTYRHSVGVNQPTWNGGEIFAGYRVGRGTFQPWYLERQTNDGGEFKAGGSIPLLRNREIDERRANVWRADFSRQLAEPEIQAQLIGFVQEASYAYWEWVAASRRYVIAKNILQLAEERTERIRRQVEEGFLDPPELTDNRRLVADRKAKLADTDRKLRQTAIKLSLYLRDPAGQPLIVAVDERPNFPEPEPRTDEQLEFDLQVAYQKRPELRYLDLKRRQLEIDVSEASNDLLPNLDAALTGSQDMGFPTSKKQDKSPFELEAALFAEMPLQRRKAQGKLTALEGKIAQLEAKRRMTSDKIVTEVRSAYVALETAYQRVLETRQAVALAEDLAQRERRNEELGLSDMLKVALREQYAVESAEKEVDALLQYHQAATDYRAAMALDQVR